MTNILQKRRENREATTLTDRHETRDETIYDTSIDIKRITVLSMKLDT